jgi:2-polyprenyl-3-methyl-5-hydroxy-6-metoxy-1,4-benzoquinol methylase
MQGPQKHPASYRDPAGFVFYNEGVIYRQVNHAYQADYNELMQSGLYEHLVSKRFLIPHHHLDQNLNQSVDCFATIQPEYIPFISYPYEWCFDMWKDAALLTLEIATTSIQYGMMLKDASAYNIAWHKGRLIHIDTLSFEKYDPSKPWIAYKQFCEHFLAPLALMHFLKVPLQSLFLGFPDGIPLSTASKMLPFRSKLNLHNYLHLHLHANSQQKSIKKGVPTDFSVQKMSNILSSLRTAINSFHFDDHTGVWSDYYHEAALREDYLDVKKQIITNCIEKMPVRSAIDLGANEGAFSELLALHNISVVCVDFDHYSINRIYKKIKLQKQNSLLPLVMDLSNPSPSIGLNNIERASFTERTQMDLVMALALIHHLAIGKNIPFEDIAQLFHSLGKKLIVEFIPKSDVKVQVMLQHKKDIYHWYNETSFLKAFSKCYTTNEVIEVNQTGRKLFIMESK